MEQAQGWMADPYGLHQERYYSQGQPTQLVRDHGQESHDPVPTATFRGPRGPQDRPQAPPGRQQQPLATRMSAPVAGPPAGWLPDSANPDQLRYWDGSRWTVHTAPRPRIEPTISRPEPATESPGKANRTRGALAIAFVIILLVVVIVIVLSGKKPGVQLASGSSASSTTSFPKSITHNRARSQPVSSATAPASTAALPAVPQTSVPAPTSTTEATPPPALQQWVNLHEEDIDNLGDAISAFAAGVTQLTSTGDTSGMTQGCQLIATDYRTLTGDPPIPDPTSESDLKSGLADTNTGYGEACTGATAIATIEGGNAELAQADNELSAATSAIVEAQNAA